MKIIMLGAPGAAKGLRQRRLLQNIIFLISPPEISSEQISRMGQNLARRQRHIWIRGFWFRMSWLWIWLLTV